MRKILSLIATVAVLSLASTTALAADHTGDHLKKGSFNNPNQIKGSNYRWDEAKNPMGSNRCTTDKQCDGARTCSSAHFCQGKSR